MKKNSFIEGTLIATLSVVLVKLMGLLYVIPFYAIIGEQGGALYGYAYNIYAIFIAISTTGVPVAISKIISEYNSLGHKEAKIRAYKIGKIIVNVAAFISFFIMFGFAKQIAMVIIGDLSGGNTISDVTVVIRAISFAVLVIPYLSLTRGYFQGHKYISPSSMSQIIEQLIRILVIIFGSYLAYKTFSKSLTFTVSVAVTGAFFGGVIASIYLKYKMFKNKDLLSMETEQDKDDITNKEIFNKILKYTIPYLVLNIGAQLYTFVDMVLILRTLGNLGFNARQVEFIASAISTWANKFNMVVNSLATGLAISLIPNIVQAFVKKDWKDVEIKINETLEMIIIIAIPVTIMISFLAKPIWTVFYGFSSTGTTVLAYSIFTALFSTLYLAIIAILQGLNKFKLAYIAGLGGFAINAILDIPLMYLFHKLNLPAYFGAITATILGYTFSICLSLISLKKKHHVSYNEIFYTLKRAMIPILLMIITLVILNNFVLYNETNKLASLIILFVKGAVAGLVYLVSSYKLKIFQKVFGAENIHRLVRKLTFNLIKLDDNK